MRKSFKRLIILLGVLILSAVLWFFFGRGDSDALWKIVSQQCVPNQQNNSNPTPCLKVDLAERYVLFKDNKGPYHDLVMPTDKITGIESLQLQHESVPAFFSLAWDNRQRLSTEVGKPLKDEWIALAINSKYGRSQNQLHLHLSCLRQDVYTVLSAHMPRIDQQWRPLPEKLVGHQYLVKRITGTDLINNDPFRLLQDYVAEQGDSIGNYGLALTASPQGDIILLANRMKLTDRNLGSAGEIQDFQCALAGN